MLDGLQEVYVLRKHKIVLGLQMSGMNVCACYIQSMDIFYGVHHLLHLVIMEYFSAPKESVLPSIMTFSVLSLIPHRDLLPLPRDCGWLENARVGDRADYSFNKNCFKPVKSIFPFRLCCKTLDICP